MAIPFRFRHYVFTTVSYINFEREHNNWSLGGFSNLLLNIQADNSIVTLETYGKIKKVFIRPILLEPIREEALIWMGKSKYHIKDI